MESSPPARPFALFLSPALQGLRFVAATLVFIGHMGWAFPGANGSLYFLVLSGYAVTRLFIYEWHKKNQLAIIPFLKKRWKKIIPGLVMAIVANLVLKAAIGAPIAWWHALSMSCLVGNYYNAFLNPPASSFASFWTLSLLFQFYFFWAICFASLFQKSDKTLKGVMLALMVGPLMLRLSLIHHGPSIFPYLYNSFETRIDTLATGCLFGLLAQGKFFEQIRRWGARTGIEPFFTISALLYLGLREDSFRLTVGFTLQSLLICLLIAQIIVLSNHRFWRWLSSPPLVYLGSLSYLFYLFHGIGKSIGHAVAPQEVIIQTICGFLSTLAIAALLAPWLAPSVRKA